MSKLEELNLADEAIEVPEEVPEQSGGFQPLPQPGTYTFRLPADLGDVWNSFERNNVERISAKFDRDNPLAIIDSPGGAYDGLTLANVSVTNVERGRGREKVMVSEMFYMIQALYQGEELPALNSNAAYAKALIAKAGKTFKAEVEWSANCSEHRDMYVEQEDGSKKQQDGTPGCGAAYYTNTGDPSNRIPVDEDNEFVDSFACALSGNECPATLRAFPRITRFKVA